MDISITAICYYAVGFAFAYGNSTNGLIGNSYYFLKDLDDYILWFFQFVFAGTTATIVSGSVAERCRFRAYVVYTIMLSSFIYPVTSHWIWSPNGFMFGKVLDFAGSGAVHLLGGAAVRVCFMFASACICDNTFL
jgi:ammonium transporter, Amt family